MPRPILPSSAPLWKTRLPPRRAHPAAFSLIELVIVVVIMGVIAAIAVPRIGAASENSLASALTGSLRVLNDAVELYAAEHDGLSPAQASDGSPDPSAVNLVSRLTRTTNSGGHAGTGGIFGPYIRAIPRNPYSGLNTVRVNGAQARAGTHGWVFDSSRRIFQADHASAAPVGADDDISADDGDGTAASGGH